MSNRLKYWHAQSDNLAYLLTYYVVDSNIYKNCVQDHFTTQTTNIRRLISAFRRSALCISLLTIIARTKSRCEKSNCGYSL